MKARAIFGFGLLVCLACQTGLLVTATFERKAPIEPDDAYVYLAEPVRLSHAAGKDAPALHSLRALFAATADRPDVAPFRTTIMGQLGVVYHPVHSLAVWGARLGGLSWETAYSVVPVGGSVLLIVSLGLWLSALWGPAAAGIALCLLGSATWFGHGCVTIVPGSFALAGFLLSTVRFLERKRGGVLCLVLGMAVVPLIHPVGRLYEGAAILFVFLLESSLTFRQKAGLAAFGIVSAAVSILVLDRLSFVPVETVSRIGLATAASAMWNNLYHARQMAFHTSFVSRSLFTVFAVPVVAWMTCETWRQRRLAASGLVVMLLLAGSLVHVLPGYPADLFGRFWVLAAALYAGCLGQFTVAWAKAAAAEVRAGWPAPRAVRRRVRGGLVLLGGLMLAQVAGAVALRGPDGLVTAFRNMVRRQDYRIESRAIRERVQATPADTRFLYLDRFSLLCGLTDGGLDRGALSYPLLADRALMDKWVTGDRNVRYAVGLNPIWRLEAGVDRDGVKVEGDNRVTIAVSSNAAGAVPELCLRNVTPAAATVRLEARFPGDDGDPYVTNRIVAARAEVWMTLPPRKWEGAGIRVTARDGALRLAGVRAHASDTSRWPWDEGLTLEVQQGDKQGRVDLTTHALWPLLPLPLKPVADDDALVTFELVHPAEQ